MNETGWGVLVYLVYMAVAVGLTYWLARTLFRAGGVFLESVFEGKRELGEAVNRLLVTGFYMLNLGYALYLVRSEPQASAFEAMQFLVNRFAVLLVTLGLVHFVNVFVFWRIRSRHDQSSVPTAPQAILVDSRE